MRSRDKSKNIAKANLLAEQRYLKSKGLLTEESRDVVMKPDNGAWQEKQDKGKARHLALYNSPIKGKLTQRGLAWLKQAQADESWTDPNVLYSLLPCHSTSHTDPFEVMNKKDPHSAVALSGEFYDVIEGQEYLDGIRNGTVEVPDSKYSHFI